MKGIKVNMEMVNCALLVVILVLVVVCCVRKNENYEDPGGGDGGDQSLREIVGNVQLGNQPNFSGEPPSRRAEDLETGSGYHQEGESDLHGFEPNDDQRQIRRRNVGGDKKMFRV
jgi:hypothetical protein